MVTDEEAAMILEERRCRTIRGCSCASQMCDANAIEPRDAIVMWRDNATAIGVPLPALAALAKGEAVVVPKVLTGKMARGLDVPSPMNPLREYWQVPWTAALAASPWADKGGA